MHIIPSTSNPEGAVSKLMVKGYVVDRISSLLCVIQIKINLRDWRKNLTMQMTQNQSYKTVLVLICVIEQRNSHGEDERVRNRDPFEVLVNLIKKKAIFEQSNGRLRAVATRVSESVTELVPLDGAEDGIGNFLGSICSQVTSFGNLEVASEKARNVMTIGSSVADNEEEFVKNANCCVLEKR
ncbi:hypothetical protein E3N88_22399 [Mikania micrantha]|uniref:Uncharacterized protein n=1 Tax=Mikania micrantha TaxID=192012 RepID=A0A5N6NCW3_9ASTR|nr:hypothetical protein E3N88_22399 [Mikania micrantha]